VKIHFPTDISAHALAKILARHALRYSIPIAFVDFLAYSRCSLVTQSSHCTLFCWSLSLFLSLCLSFSMCLVTHIYSYMHGFLARAVPVQLVESLLLVRTEISVRKFRSLATSESTTKLNINFPMPSYVLQFLFSSLLSLSPSSDEKVNEWLQAPKRYIAKDYQKSQNRLFLQVGKYSVFEIFIQVLNTLRCSENSLI